MIIVRKNLVFRVLTLNPQTCFLAVDLSEIEFLYLVS